MSFLLLAVLGFVAVAAAGFALVPGLAGGSRADKRMRALQGDIQGNRREASATRNRETRRKEIQQNLKQQTELLEKRRKRIPLQDRIFQAGLKIKRNDFVRNQIILGVVVFVGLFLFVDWYYAAIFGAAAGYLLPRMYLANRRKAYQNKFLDELPNAVEAIVRGVKSGLPLNDSIRVVAKEVKEPVRSEFQRVLDQQSVGKSMTEAVQILFDRVPLPEVNFFVVVITVQQQAGGNLSEALGNLAHVLRNRKKMKAKVKAMSSEAKASAGIVGSLPFIVALLVNLTTPGYMAPLFETPIGNIWLAIAVIMMGIGIFIMKKMIEFDI
ncbi:MAG TPA: type II secretion system F family protein [Devosia sp.]